MNAKSAPEPEEKKTLDKKSSIVGKRETKPDPAKVMRQINKSQTSEPPLDIADEQLNFIDDCFGESSNIE